MSNLRLLVATGNRHKLGEIEEIFTAAEVRGVELLALDSLPGYEVPEEDGETFADNAFIKAAAAAAASGLATLADDSGLTVAALNGAPGVRSARYAGEACDNGANRAKLLAALATVPEGQRQAAFVCSAALLLPQADGSWQRILCEGSCLGRIGWAEKGAGGFGYDPLFIPAGGELTMAELSPEAKNAISHRGQAMRKIAEVLKKL